MKTLQDKLNQAIKLTEKLVNTNDICKQSDRYYFVLRVLQTLRTQIREELNKNIRTVETVSNKCYFDKPELKITSTTYIRSQKSLDKQINNRFTNR